MCDYIQHGRVPRARRPGCVQRVCIEAKAVIVEASKEYDENRNKLLGDCARSWGVATINSGETTEDEASDATSSSQRRRRPVRKPVPIPPKTSTFVPVKKTSAAQTSQEDPGAEDPGAGVQTHLATNSNPYSQAP